MCLFFIGGKKLRVSSALEGDKGRYSNNFGIVTHRLPLTP